MTTKYATANVFKGMSLFDARAAVDKVLEERPDVLALQEWAKGRTIILRGLHRRGYGYSRPPEGGGPIVWDRSRYGLLHCRPATLARSEFIGRLVGRRSRLGKSIANLTILHDDQTGHDVAFVNFHLTAEVQTGGRYRADKEHAPRVRRHKREVRRLELIVRRQKRKGRPVVLLGDTNFQALRIRGVTSCWAGQISAGTLGNRSVDVIYAEKPSVHVIPVKTGSDHRAVVALYK